jgi:chitinase
MPFLPLKKNKRALVAGLAALLLFVASCSKQPDGQYTPRVIAYIYGKHFSVGTKVPATSLTHVNYAFALIREGVPSLPGSEDEKNLYYLTSLTSKNPELKIILSVGGWSGSKTFSDVALTDSSRRLFASRLAVLVSTYNLDGVDIDWEYPGQEGAGNVYRPADKYNFSLLLEAIRIALDRMSFLSRDGKPYILSVSAGADRAWLDHVIMQDVVLLVDYINVMTYDYHGDWEDVTGHHTNLYVSSCEPQGYSVNRTVKMFREAGVPPQKLVIGGALYGYWWKGVQDKNDGLCRRSSGERGEVTYHTIADSLMEQEESKILWDKKAHAPWLWNEQEKMFITFDDPRSLADKARYVRKEHLGGIMLWELSGDRDGELVDAVVNEIY